MAIDWSDPNRGLIELGRRCRTIHHRIHTPLSELTVDAWVTPEPVPYEQRTVGVHRRIRSGESWGRLWDCAWFHFSGSVPAAAAGQRIVLLIDVSGEGLAVDDEGRPIQGLTTAASEFDRTHGLPGKRVVPIADCAHGRETVDLWVDAGCNDLFGGYRNTGELRQACIAVESVPMRNLYYDFSVLLDFAANLNPDDPTHAIIPTALRNASNRLSRYDDDEAEEARAILAPIFDSDPESSGRSVYAVGQAHIDLAWLWPIRETIRKAGRTFATALTVMDRYPEYVFGASQPQLYEWVRVHYPSLFSRIQERVSEGRWELQGAMWVEADVNLPSGESLVRQIIYGSRYWQDHFGLRSTIAWLPDDFGFPASLPQILAKSGINRFMTTKLSWNTVNRFPLTTFWWEGIDGSRVLAHIPPEGNYNSSALPHAIRNIARDHFQIDESPSALLIYGIGDGGGGPGEEHLERLRRVKRLTPWATVQHDSAADFFARVESNSADLPVHQADLYLERHQGTFTSQSRSKSYNRRLERQLRELEFVASWSSLGHRYEYPHEQLERIWKEVLLYQFHDILPGSSITRVYDESLSRYEVLMDEVESLSRDARMAIPLSASSSESSAGTLVTNSLSWPRQEWIRLSGRWVNIKVPSFGYVAVGRGEANASFEVSAWEFGMENDLLRITFHADGSISSIYDKENSCEVVSDGANLLTLFDDPGDAWDFPYDYRDRRMTRLVASSLETGCDGPSTFTRLRFITAAGSVVDQEVRICSGSRRIEFLTQIRWNETNKMLRTQFPVSVKSDVAQAGIQFGSITRSTRRGTAIERARDEVCAHGWVDISDGEYGVALLTDGKYGHRLWDNTLDLNLLRSPTSPDPAADLAIHEFTYALLPHRHGFEAGRVVMAAAEFRNPLVISALEVDGCPEQRSLLSVTGDGVVVETIKRSEDRRHLVVRLYEAHGRSLTAHLSLNFPVARVHLADLMERPICELASPAGNVSVPFGPFEIQTLVVESPSDGRIEYA